MFKSTYSCEAKLYFPFIRNTYKTPGWKNNFTSIRVEYQNVSKEVFAALSNCFSLEALNNRHYQNSILNGDSRGTELKRINEHP